MRVGFLGLGVQGLPLAENIVAGGYVLTGYDPRSEPMEQLQRHGARLGKDPADVAQASDLILICVATDQQVLSAVEAMQPSLSAGKVIVVHSTVAPTTITHLQAMLEGTGVALVDAPVSGGARGAQERTMTYMAGGDDAILDRCEPVFRLSGSSILRTGPLGSATIAKLAHQVAIIGNIQAMAEAVRLGTAAGLSSEIVKQAISAGAARSYIAETWGEIAMAPHAIPIYGKDLDNSLALARTVGVSLPGAEHMKPRLADFVP